MRGKYRIEWLAPAKHDLRKIVLYLLERAPLVALGVQEQFEQQLSALQEFPHIGQKNAFIPEILDFKIKGLPYIAVYKISPKDHLVEILSILHERENRADLNNYRF
jgi:plasmid stabilization system protein ParE